MEENRWDKEESIRYHTTKIKKLRELVEKARENETVGRRRNAKVGIK